MIFWIIFWVCFALISKCQNVVVYLEKFRQSLSQISKLEKKLICICRTKILKTTPENNVYKEQNEGCRDKYVELKSIVRYRIQSYSIKIKNYWNFNQTVKNPFTEYRPRNMNANVKCFHCCFEKYFLVIILNSKSWRTKVPEFCEVIYSQAKHFKT